MATFNQAMDTFISITGTSVAVALRKLKRHGGDLNAAVNEHFSEGDRSGDRNVVCETSVATHQDDLFNIDDPIEVPMGRNPLSPLLEASMTIQKAIDTFISITGAPKAIALQKLEQHGGDLNAAVNTHFSEGVRSGHRNVVHETSVATHQEDLLDIGDPVEIPMRRNPLSPQLECSMTNPFSLLDPHFQRRLFGDVSHFMDSAPFVSQPREVGEIPVVVKDSDFDDLPEYSHDIEEEMIHAAIEASKWEAQQHGGDLNMAVNEHFSEEDRSGDRNVVHETSVASHQDLLDIDDPIEVPMRRNPLSPLFEASMKNPFSLLDPHFQSLFMPAVQPTEEASSELPVHQASSSRNTVQHNEIPNTNIHAVQTASQALDLTPSASTPPDGDEIVEVSPVHYPSIDSSPVDLSCPPVESISAKTDRKKDDGGSSSCVICEDAPVEGACVPCGHMAGCMSCLNEIKAKKLDCPVCRVKIDQVIKLYAV